jgi:hypothetical protein
MSGFGLKATAAAVAISLCVVPTAAIGASPAPAVPATSATATSPWVTLSALSANSSAATTAVALQDDDGPGFPPIAPLVVILATIALAVYIAVKDDNDDLDFEFPVSPD